MGLLVATTGDSAALDPTVHWQSMMGGLTTISLGGLVAFHLAFGLGNLLKVPPYNPSANLVGDGTPGKGETPIEKLLEGVFACWYLSSIAAVLLTLKLGSLHSQRAALLCPLFYHAIVALYLGFSSTQMFNPSILTNGKAALLHVVFALFATHAYCTLE